MAALPDPSGSPPASPPGGEVYDWYQRGVGLLERGDADAAVQLLEHARAHAPDANNVLEALARALFDARRFSDAHRAFSQLVERDPGSDYALFGLGLSLTRLDRFSEAVDHLALAAAMRPRPEYTLALSQARATLRFRDGPTAPAIG